MLQELLFKNKTKQMNTSYNLGVPKGNNLPEIEQGAKTENAEDSGLV